MNCPKCGNIISSGENFCKYCGYNFIGANSNNNYNQGNNGFNPNNNYNNNYNNNNYNNNYNSFGIYQANNNINNLNNNNPYNYNNTSNQIPNFTTGGTIPNINNQPNLEINNNRPYERYEEYETNNLLIDSYIGKNADQICSGDFCFPAFFFGPFYLLYRKIYLVAIVWIAINYALVEIFPSNEGDTTYYILRIITIVVNVVVGLKFKEKYVEYAEKKVNKIKEQNPDRDINSLARICTKKGGTSLVPVVLFIVALFMIIFIIAAYRSYVSVMNNALYEIKEEMDYQGVGSTTTKTVDKLKVDFPDKVITQTIPSGVVGKYSTDKSNCRFIVTSTPTDAKSVDEYLESNPTYNENNAILSDKINNYLWSYTHSVSNEGTNKYTYFAIYEGSIYKVSSEINLNEDYGCTYMESSIISSLTFVKSASSSM